MINGCNLIGFEESKNGKITFKSYNPKTLEYLEDIFSQTTEEEIKKALKFSKSAFSRLKEISPIKKAEFLERIIENLNHEKQEIIDRCMLETALPEGRLSGEFSRTINQIKMFAEHLKEGSYCNAKIDSAIPDRAPIPKPDIRQMLTPIGPVAVFGASNFPLAFSVAGGDTISALAAGCPVIVKAHPNHPGTSELVGKAIVKTVKECDFPEGTFSLIHGFEYVVGEILIKAKEIKAVGFTGSFNGGKALFDLAKERECPIPVYAEMGSVNPIFILKNTLKVNLENIVKGLINSANLGVGQFCTNPGVVILEKCEESKILIEKLKNQVSQIEPGTMLSENISKMYKKNAEKLSANSAIVAEGLKGERETSVNSKVFCVKGEIFRKNKNLHEEVFGPSTLIVLSKNKDETYEIAKNLNGQLTISIFGTETELEENEELINIVKEKAGRIIFNNFPTGVEVCHSMHHGGPFPATIDSKYTSVGTESIKRFLRPVCFQNFPDKLLPPQLQNKNPLGIQRQVNGEYTKKQIDFRN